MELHPSLEWDQEKDECDAKIHWGGGSDQERLTDRKIILGCTVGAGDPEGLSQVEPEVSRKERQLEVAS